MIDKKEIIEFKEHIGEECDTIFYQGNGSSQTQVLKYVGDYKIVATTGEQMWCTGRNNLLPLKVIYNVHLKPEIMDVNLCPIDNNIARFNPFRLIPSMITWVSNWQNGFHFTPSISSNGESVRYHAPIFSQISIGQETDINSHKRKYDSWLEQDNKSNSLILWGVSRGTAATFCAFAQYKYKEVKLVVLEGAIDSISEVLPTRFPHYVAKSMNTTFSFFKKHSLMQYDPEGPSPLKSVDEFPKGVPVVFITSKIDKVVTCKNTENIAYALADKGKNDVYLLVLEHSSHPNYMFDDREDRDNYETFIHAIYKKYNLQHDPELAERGTHLVGPAMLYEVTPTEIELKMAI